MKKKHSNIIKINYYILLIRGENLNMTYLTFIREDIESLKKYGFIKPDGTPVSDTEAKTLYKKLARKNHPDLHQGEENKYEDIMKEINSANDEFKKRQQTNNWRDETKSGSHSNAYQGYKDAQSRRQRWYDDIWNKVNEEEKEEKKEREKKYEKKYKFTEKDKEKYGDISEKLKKKKDFYKNASFGVGMAGYGAGSGFLLNAVR